MNEEQIKTMTGILEGRGFSWGGVVFRYCPRNKAFMFDGSEGGAVADWYAGSFVHDIATGQITLVPQPPEPLSDEIGELLWKYLNSDCGPSIEDRKKLEGAGLIDENGWVTVPEGERGLGEYLMRKNGGE